MVAVQADVTVTIVDIIISIYWFLNFISNIRMYLYYILNKIGGKLLNYVNKIIFLNVRK